MPQFWRVTFLLLLIPVASLFAQTNKVTKRPFRSQVNDITQENSEHLTQLLKSNPQYFKNILNHLDKYRVQIIYTQINRTAKNKPYVRHHTFNLDTTLYFFPASMVKMPSMLMALEKINTLKIPGLTKFSKMVVKEDGGCQYRNTPSEGSKKYGYPNLAHYIKDCFVASGNISYDRLYEFCGQKYLNESLHKKGYTSSQITQRYGRRCTMEENRQTNPMIFYHADTPNVFVYSQPNVVCDTIYNIKLHKLDVNRRYRHNAPAESYYRNFISLKDMHQMLMAIMIPRIVPKQQRFNLTQSDYRFLHKYMSMTPPESNDPEYEPGYFTHTRMKYLLYGAREKADPNVRIFNKVGLALGFATDCAYIVDFETKTEFFLSATIYCPDETGNGDYQYYGIGFPFLQHLGEVLLKYERTRERKYLPQQLHFYKHDYSVY